MNLDVNFKCLVRRSWFTKDPEDIAFDHCIAFGAQTLGGKILTFHIMTDYGMLRSRVPLSEVYVKEPTSDIPHHYKQLWDCFGEVGEVVAYEYLCGKRAQVVLKDKTVIWGTYMFTIDWLDNPYSEEPTDYKCGHVLAADAGYLLCQPNNRIQWRDSNFITREFPVDKKRFKVDTELFSVESCSDRWVSEDGDCFYYDVKEERDK